MHDDDVDPAELERLAVAWRGGDRDAFRELVLRTGRGLRLYVSSLCDSRELVDEVLQATYVALFERIERYEPRGLFRAWLERIAHNLVMDHWRRRRRVAELDGDALALAVADSGLGDLERADERAVETRRLHACLDRLPPRARALVEGRHLQERPLDELARQFKQTANALAVALHRIRRSLRECMERGA